jgi:ADP-heptose:LPS heptosyltransferase
MWPRMAETRRHILVIKLGALGDFVLAFGPFAAIRAHHAGDHVALLTAAPFATLARASPWFDAVLVDAKPPWWNLVGLVRLGRQFRGWDLVYDLQTSGRSSRYFRLAGRPAWSGIAPGCSLPHRDPARDRLHTVERQRGQLQDAGITSFPEPDLDWLTASGPRLPEPYALIAPGAAPHRPAKRWSPRRFGMIAYLLHRRGLHPVIVGTAQEKRLAAIVRDACPEALDLTGQTSLLDLGGLAARAQLAVGNDTGPMHLAAAVGCPSVVLFSGESDPVLTAPRGRWVRVLCEPDLADLPVERVAAALP